MISYTGEINKVRTYYFIQLKKRLKQRYATVIRPAKSIIYAHIVGQWNRIIDMIDIDKEEFTYVDPLTGKYVWEPLSNLSTDQLAELLDEIFDDRFAIEE